MIKKHIFYLAIDLKYEIIPISEIARHLQRLTSIAIEMAPPNLLMMAKAIKKEKEATIGVSKFC